MFFERFREALVRLPAGLIRAGQAAAPQEIAAVERELGTRLPPSFVAFLESFDGADLFHETVLLAGVGAEAPRRLLELNQCRPTTEPVFAEVAGGDRFAFQADGRVLRLRADSEAAEGEAETAAAAGVRSDLRLDARGAGECWIAGGDFSRWLDGLIAYHRVLYDADGEFAAD
ncbi:MAG: SMI1/KNR4 family protein, partial [Myxococcales bacterium]